MPINPSNRPALALFYTTDGGSTSGTDDIVTMTVYYDDGASEAFDVDLPGYDMRAPGRTDMCVFSLASSQRSFEDITKIELKLTGTDGWKIANLWVVWLGNCTDKRLLLAAPGVGHWLDDAAGRSRTKSWNVPYFHPQPAGQEPRLWLVHRTADVTDAGTDSEVYFDLRTKAGQLRAKLDLPHDDRLRLRSDEYVFSDQALGDMLDTLQPGEACIDNRGTGAWLPDYVFLIGWKSGWASEDGGFRLLGCPDRWSPAATLEYGAWFDRQGCAAHSINWIGDARLLAGPAMTRLVQTENGLSADVWMWSVPKREPKATFEIVRSDGTKRSVTAMIQQDESNAGYGWIRVYRVSGLEPGAEQTLRTSLFGATIDLRIAPPAADKARLVFVSCCDTARSPHPAEALHRMGASMPDAAIFGGDNVYFVSGDSTSGPIDTSDWLNESTKTRRHLDGRSRPEAIRLMRTAPIYATWDDHDFDANDSSGLDLNGAVVLRDGAPLREVSARAFRRAWPGPYQMADATKAIHGSFRHGPVEVFLTDGRYDRRAGSEATVIFGAKQVDEWLLPALSASTAPVIVLVSSSQLLQEHSGAAHESTSQERKKILERLNSIMAQSPSRRALVLSGDPHFSELMTLSGAEVTTYPALVTAGGPYHLMEATSSPGRRKDDGSSSPGGSAGRIQNVLYSKNGYVQVDVDTTGSAPKITLTFYSVSSASQSTVEAVVTWSESGGVTRSV